MAGAPAIVTARRHSRDMSTRRKNNRPRAVQKRSAGSPPLDTRSPLRRASESDEFYVGRSLVDRCGSIDSVEGLTSDVLAPDPFDWSIVPAEDRAVVEVMLGLLESVCEDHLDSEYFTVMKRLIEVAAIHPEQPLRARTSPDRLAAALLWIGLVANMDRLLMSSRGTARIWWWFDVTSCSRLARKVATTLGFRPEPRFEQPVGWDQDQGVYTRNPALLTSRCRMGLISQRERVNEMIVEEEERRRLERPMIRSGNQVRMRLVETDYAMAARTSLESGRQVVVLGLGGTSDDPDHLFSLSIPEARRLLAGMQCAVDSLPTIAE